MPRSLTSRCCYPRHTTAWSFLPFPFSLSPLAASLCLLPNTHTKCSLEQLSFAQALFPSADKPAFPLSHSHTHTAVPLLAACRYLHLSCISTHCLAECCLSSICLSGAFLLMLQLVGKGSCFSAPLSAKDIQTKIRKTF